MNLEGFDGFVTSRSFMGMKRGLVRRVERLEAATCAVCEPLGISGIRASLEGREPNEKESAANETYDAEMERLSLLAGFGSVAELNALIVHE